VSDKVFKFSIIIQFYDIIMNEMINKFETMMLSLQTIVEIMSKYSICEVVCEMLDSIKITITKSLRIQK
jgi:uncharacterized protein YfbU (UPF0304 family)